MPTYEYRCPDGHEFELFQRMSEPPRAACPTCGKQAQRLLSSGAGLLFKGSGFYTTDYRPEGYRKAAEADKGDGAKPAPESGKSAPESAKPDSSPKKDGGSAAPAPAE